MIASGLLWSCAPDPPFSAASALLLAFLGPIAPVISERSLGPQRSRELPLETVDTFRTGCASIPEAAKTYKTLIVCLPLNLSGCQGREHRNLIITAFRNSNGF